MSTGRVAVRRTPKLYVGGAFTRSESGRSYEVFDRGQRSIANVACASRKDIRDAVVAGRKAWPLWAGLTAYNRGQVMYRVAEMMEARRSELMREIAHAENDAESQIDEAVDLWVWYAGWTDKLAQVMGSLNQVAGPYFNLTVPESVGVVGVIAPDDQSLAGLVRRLAPALCGGNTVVTLCSEPHPLPAVALAECLATADVPAGAVNLLTGHKDELAPVLAAHQDVDALDATGAHPQDLETLEAAAAGNVKRVVTGTQTPSPYEVTALMEMKTVWHPKGA
jgi:acyl-CoA reductase-like NAD-dependent aldehyde dehydrogenase